MSGIADLEKLLHGPATESTDLKLFLAVAGITYDLAYSIRPFSPEIDKYMRERYHRHRDGIGACAKRAETRLRTLGQYEPEGIFTLSDLRRYVGISSSLPFVNCNIVSWNRWNVILAARGLEPMLYGKDYRDRVGSER